MPECIRPRSMRMDMGYTFGRIGIRYISNVSNSNTAADENQPAIDLDESVPVRHGTAQVRRQPRLHGLDDYALLRGRQQHAEPSMARDSDVGLFHPGPARDARAGQEVHRVFKKLQQLRIKLSSLCFPTP